MSYSLILLPSVAEELTRTLNEWQEQFDAGRALLAELVMVFGKIRERPLRYPIVYADVHRALTTRFHFAIFFEVVQERSEVIVLAALHQRRDPALWPTR
jgi:plasmid stabilization system protein ParE